VTPRRTDRPTDCGLLSFNAAGRATLRVRMFCCGQAGRRVPCRHCAQRYNVRRQNGVWRVPLSAL